jgi:ribose 5-phosphate isomerase RpiB
MKKIYIGSDHAGFELKEKLKIYIKELGYEIEDKGAFSLIPQMIIRFYCSCSQRSRQL